VKNNDWIGLMVIGGIIVLGLVGGVKNSNSGLSSTNNTSKKTSEASIQKEIKKAETQVKELQKQVQAKEDAKNNSKYYGLVDMQYVNRSSSPAKEYVALKVSYNATGTIPITGWTLKSSSTNNSVSIPKGIYLFFAGTQNLEEEVYVKANDVVYVVTGISPNGYGFKTNKCSGYLEQFQNFIPYIDLKCPLPKNEDLSGIPKIVINDACFEHINRMPRCKIQTKSLPANWSYECTNFIYNKINYPSCVNTHKNDKDFYLGEWRLYLKRSDILWKDSREEIVLYDNLGKIVDKLKY
jgi:hypothetical protein